RARPASPRRPPSSTTATRATWSTKSTFTKKSSSCSVKWRLTAKNRRCRDSSLARSTAATRASRSSGRSARISRRRPSRSGSTAKYVAASDMAGCAAICLDRNRARCGSGPLSQPQTNGNIGCAGEDQVDPEKQPENIKARDRPARQDDGAEQERDDAGQHHPAPRRSALHAERQHDAHDARDQERGSQQQRQQHRRQQRIFEGDDAGEDVERAEQQPEDELAPGLDLERVDDFRDAGDHHHYADDEHARHRRGDDAAERDQADDDEDDAERDDPAALRTQRREFGPNARRSNRWIGHGSALADEIFRSGDNIRARRWRKLTIARAPPARSHARGRLRAENFSRPGPVPRPPIDPSRARPATIRTLPRCRRPRRRTP